MNNRNKLSNINCKDIIIDYKEEEVKTKEREHYHNAYEIAFFIRANINIFAKNIKYKISDGDLLFIDSYDLHKIIYKNNDEYIRFVLNISEEFLNYTLEEMKIGKIFEKIKKTDYKKITTSLKEREHLKYIFQYLHKIKNNKTYDYKNIRQAIIKSQLVTIITRIYDLMQSKPANISIVFFKKNS